MPLLAAALCLAAQLVGSPGCGGWASDTGASVLQQQAGATAAAGAAPAPPPPPRATVRYEHQTMAELVLGAGYPLEEHFVTTSDGYVLAVYRLPHGRSSVGGVGIGVGIGGSTRSPRRPPVLLQHGLLDSSAAWVLNAPDSSLGFVAADAGFDVWLGNSRGNAFSRNHTGLDPATPAFWDWSFDEMAGYDLPAVTAYILRATGAATLAYVGHSQGSTQMFAALGGAGGGEMAARLSGAVMLAPAVHMRYVQSLPMVLLAQMQADKVCGRGDAIDMRHSAPKGACVLAPPHTNPPPLACKPHQLVNLLGASEFLPSEKAAADLFGQVCRATPLACASVITAICGFNPDNVNLTRLPEYIQYAPSGGWESTGGWVGGWLGGRAGGGGGVQEARASVPQPQPTLPTHTPHHRHQARA